MNRDEFFRELRGSLFRGGKGFSQSQVDGLDSLLNVWEDEYSEYPDQFLAYCLATAWHETAFTMQPIREYGRGRGRTYGRKNKQTGHAYYGRGYVQLTWAFNYKRAGKELGMKLFENPDKVMMPDIAAQILYTGCIEGWFTTKKLSDYITDNKCNYRQCRRIVNGMDKASAIAGYARQFETAIKEARDENITERKLEQAGSRTIKAAKSNKDAGGAVVGIGVAGGAAEALKRLKGVTENLGDWRSVIDTLIDSFVWLSSYWWAGLLAAGGLVLWNNRAIIKARISDEVKIGRLADGSD